MGRLDDKISIFERGDITWNSEKNECYVSIKNGNAQMVRETTAIRLQPVSMLIPEENVPFESGTQANSIRYLCPNCGTCFEVPEDSDDYLVDCPGCGNQLDLTELEPES